jgi:hypothetical protein
MLDLPHKENISFAGWFFSFSDGKKVGTDAQLFTR